MFSEKWTGLKHGLQFSPVWSSVLWTEPWYTKSRFRFRVQVEAWTEPKSQVPGSEKCEGELDWTELWHHYGWAMATLNADWPADEMGPCQKPSWELWLLTGQSPPIASCQSSRKSTWQLNAHSHHSPLSVSYNRLAMPWSDPSPQKKVTRVALHCAEVKMLNSNKN